MRLILLTCTLIFLIGISPAFASNYFRPKPIFDYHAKPSVQKFISFYLLEERFLNKRRVLATVQLTVKF